MMRRAFWYSFLYRSTDITKVILKEHCQAEKIASPIDFKPIFQPIKQKTEKNKSIKNPNRPIILIRLSDPQKKTTSTLYSGLGWDGRCTYRKLGRSSYYLSYMLTLMLRRSPGKYWDDGVRGRPQKSCRVGQASANVGLLFGRPT